MFELGRDLKAAIRSLRRSPAFTLAATVILALASGAVTATFSVIHGVLIRPLPVADQDRLVIAWKEDYAAGFAHFPFSPPSLRALAAQMTTIESFAASDYNGALPYSTVDDGNGSEIPTGLVSGDLFRVLGIQPILGRLFGPDDDVNRGPKRIIISEKLWRIRFGSDSSIIGKPLRIFGQPLEIVGVLPADYEYPRRAVAWIPVKPWLGPDDDGNPDNVSRDLVARLKPGVTLAQFHSELETVRAREPLEQRKEFAKHRVVTRMFADEVLGDLRPSLFLLGAGALLVLAVASANLGSLLLVRTGTRLREVAVRAAIGGGRGEVLRAVLTEQIVVVLVGVAGGILAAGIGLALAQQFVPLALPRSGGFALTSVALLTGITVSLCAGIAATIPSVVALSRADLLHALRSGGRTATGNWGTHPLRRVLVASQLGLAVTAVAGAGLLVRTVERLTSIDLGFDPRNVVFAPLTVDVIPGPEFQARVRALMMELLDNVKRVPGVSDAAMMSVRPLPGNAGGYSRLLAEARPPSDFASMPLAARQVISPGFFTTMGIPLLRGSFFTGTERADSPPVVIINESVAKAYWPGGDPIGRRITTEGPGQVWATVVGVTGDTRYDDLRRPIPTIYYPHFQGPETAFNLVVKVAPSLSIGAIAPALRRIVHDTDRGLAVESVTPFPSLLREPVQATATVATLTALFALVALGLAAVGIYGVLSSFVLQRTREIGVRMALGASGSIIRRLVIGQGWSLVAAGLGVGLLGAVAVGRGLRGFLYEISPLDPITLGFVAALLVIVALAAMLFPASRAARVDPAESLRSD